MCANTTVIPKINLLTRNFIFHPFCPHAEHLKNKIAAEISVSRRLIGTFLKFSKLEGLFLLERQCTFM